MDSGHFSVEDRTSDWLMEQGGRSFCRSCREGGRNIERASSSIAQTIVIEEEQEECCETNKTEELKEENCVKYKIEKEDCVKYRKEKDSCNLPRKKCSCRQCALKF